MRNLTAAAIALACAAGPAAACIPMQYVSGVAIGKVRTSRGEWVPIRIETDRSLMRIEYASSASPTGLFAITGHIDDGWAYRFPAGRGWTPKQKPNRSTFQRLMDQAGLPAWSFIDIAYETDPVRVHRGMKCQLTKAKSFDGVVRRETGAQLCLHAVQDNFAGGIPLMATNARGERVLDVQKVDLKPVPLERFNPPKPRNGAMIVAARTPQTCSG